jgi:hypothetical protein
VGWGVVIVWMGLTGDSGYPGRDDFAVDKPADEHEAGAAESVCRLESRDTN